MTVTILTTPLSYRVQVDESGRLVGTNVSIVRFCEPFTEYTFDKRFRRFIPARKYRYYNTKRQTLYLPRYDLDRFLDFLTVNGVRYEIRELPLSRGKPVDIQLKPGVQDKTELQTNAIRHITTSNAPLRGLALQTGCIAGTMQVTIVRAGLVSEMTLAEAYEKYTGQYQGHWKVWDPEVTVYTRAWVNGRIQLNQVLGMTNAGHQWVYRLTLDNGFYVELTFDHRVMTREGWREAWACENHEVMCDLRDENGQPTYARVVSFEEIESEQPTYDIACAEPHDNFVVNGVVVHNSGKTYTAIKVASLTGVRTAIACSGLVDQWVQALKRFTTLEDDDIYVVQGNASLVKLVTQIGGKINPKVILFSLGTIRGWCTDKEMFENYPFFDDLGDLLEIGLWITDEAHLNFHLNLMLNLRLRVAITLVLTATFDNARPDVKAIFDAHYPPSIRFGEDQYDKYVDVYAYSYSTGHGDIPIRAYKSKEGYSHTRLEDWYLNNKHKLDHLFNRVYIPISYIHYYHVLNPGERYLVLCASEAMCRYFIERLKHERPDLRVELYVYGVPDSVLAEADIIVSTPGSAGTGRDIPNLRTVFCTISIRSSPLNKQILGRLRKLPNPEVTPIFVICHNQSVPQQVDYARARQLLFTPLAKSYTTGTL